MTKKISITVSDHTYETYLSGIYKNRSAFIEKLIILGTDSILNQEQTNKALLVKTLQEKQNLENELRHAKLTIENLKTKLSGDSEELRRVNAMAKSIKASGFLENLP